NCAPAEIGRVEEAVARGAGGEGKPRVDNSGRGVIDREKVASRINDGGPAREGAVLADEQEAAGRGNSVVRNDEPGPTVEDSARGSAARARGRGNRHDE